MQVKAGGEAFEVEPLGAVENGWAYDVTPPSSEVFRVTVRLAPTAVVADLPWQDGFFPGSIRPDPAPAFEGAFNPYQGALYAIRVLLEETALRETVILEVYGSGAISVLDPDGNKLQDLHSYYR